jgi:hypothetical protein
MKLVLSGGVQVATRNTLKPDASLVQTIPPPLLVPAETNVGVPLKLSLNTVVGAVIVAAPVRFVLPPGQIEVVKGVIVTLEETGIEVTANVREGPTAQVLGVTVMFPELVPTRTETELVLPPPD